MKRPLKHTRKDVEETKNKKEGRSTRTNFWQKLNNRTCRCQTNYTAQYKPDFIWQENKYIPAYFTAGIFDPKHIKNSYFKYW